MEALGWSDFDLVAHSSAAAIAVDLLLAHPGIAADLILISPVPIEGIHTPVEALTLLDQMRAVSRSSCRGVGNDDAFVRPERVGEEPTFF